MNGSYAEYKLCTATFVNWIVENAKKKSKKAKVPSLTVSTLILLTNEMAKSSSLHEIESCEKALNAGRKAIELRQFFHAHYTENPGSEVDNHTHAYFIKALKYCYFRISKWIKDFQVPSKQAPPEMENSTNSFELLENFDGCVDGDFAWPSGVNRDALLKELMEKEVKDLEVMCFMKDVVTTYDEILAIWRKLQRQETSYIAAAAVTMLGIQMLTSLEKRVQLKFPELKSFEMLVSYPFNASFQAYLATTQFFRLTEKYRDLYKNDGLLVTHLPKQLTPIALQEQAYVFSESTSLGFSPENVEECSSFLLTELAIIANNRFIYEAIVPADAVGLQRFGASGVRYFMAPIYHFLHSQVVTLDLVFVLQLWLEIVTILHDPATLFMSKLIYCMREPEHALRRNYFSSRVQASIHEVNFPSQGAVNIADLHASSNGCFGQYRLFHNNPLLQAITAYDSIARSINILNEAGIGTINYCKPMCQLYQALRQEKYIQEAIPVMELIMAITAKDAFMNLDKLPTKGQYLNNAAQSMNFSAAGIASSKDPSKKLKGRTEFLNHKRFRGTNYNTYESFLCKLLQDSSEVVDSSMLTSIPSLLSSVEAIATAEMYETRLFNVDYLLLHIYCHDLVNELRKKVPNYERQFQDCMDDGPDGPSTFKMQWLTGMHLTAFSSSLMCMEFHALDDNIPPGANRKIVKEHLQAFGRVMAEFMGAIDISADLQLIPDTLKVVELEFGEGSAGGKMSPPSEEGREQLLQEKVASYMKQLDEVVSTARSGAKKDHAALLKILKEDLRRYPQLLQLRDDAAHAEVRTILDYIIWSEPTNPFGGYHGSTWSIVHWFTALGGCLPMKLTVSSSSGVGKQSASNHFSHLQHACRQGSKEVFTLILAATAAADLNYVNEKDGCTAAHYTYLKADYLDCFELYFYKPDATIRNCEGKTIADIAKEKKFDVYFYDAAQKPFYRTRAIRSGWRTDGGKAPTVGNTQIPAPGAPSSTKSSGVSNRFAHAMSDPRSAAGRGGIPGFPGGGPPSRVGAMGGGGMFPDLPGGMPHPGLLNRNGGGDDDDDDGNFQTPPQMLTMFRQLGFSESDIREMTAPKKLGPNGELPPGMVPLGSVQSPNFVANAMNAVRNAGMIDEDSDDSGYKGGMRAPARKIAGGKPPAPPTAADFANAEQAQKELLAMLDDEESKPKKKSSKKKGKK